VGWNGGVPRASGEGRSGVGIGIDLCVGGYTIPLPWSRMKSVTACDISVWVSWCQLSDG